MKPKTTGIYRMLSAGEVLIGEFDKFVGSVKVKAIYGTLSAFPKIHCSLIVATEKIDVRVWYKQTDKILFILNSGSAGTANAGLSGVDVDVEELHFLFWAHNMNWFGSLDFHGDIIMYVEEGGEIKT